MHPYLGLTRLYATTPPVGQLQDLEEPSLNRDKTRPDVMILELTSEEQRIYSNCNAACNAVLPSLLTNIEHSCK